jgi:hypothetical protein
MALRLRRGTNAERQLLTPLQGELIYATDTKKLYVGDGAAVGGILVGPIENNLVNDLTPQLGGDLDLNSNNITGTGNINIDGTITATGNIGLGDADDDSITVGGVINSSLRPAQTQTYTLGTENRQWQHVYTGGATIDQELTVESIALSGNIVNNASSTIYNATTDTLTAANIQGDITGSVLSDDSSTIFVDADQFRVGNGTLTLNADVIESSTNELTIGSTQLTEVTVNSNNFTMSKTGIDASTDNMPFSTIQGSRASNADVQVGDLIGAFAVAGLSGGAMTPKVIITGKIDTVTGTNTLPGKIEFGVQDYDGGFTSEVSVNSRHHLAAPVVKHTPFANAAARDTAIPSSVVEAGMVIYLQDTNKLQINNDGSITGWVDLH